MLPSCEKADPIGTYLIATRRLNALANFSLRNKPIVIQNKESDKGLEWNYV